MLIVAEMGVNKRRHRALLDSELLLSQVCRNALKRARFKTGGTCKAVKTGGIRILDKMFRTD